MKNKILIFLVTFVFSLLSLAKTDSNEKFKKTIQKHLTEIQNCSSEAATKNVGNVVVDLEVNENASLHRIKINEAKTTIQDLNIQKCVVDILKKVRYPKAKKSKTVMFSYTVEFK